jgi:hypothetical protein
MSLENLLNLQIVLRQAGIKVDALVAYYYTLILMASWVQAIFVHKKLKPQMKPQDLQKLPTHQLYADVLASDRVVELQALYATLKALPHITKAILDGFGGKELEAMKSLYNTLLERKGVAPKKVNPKQDWESLLKWARGQMISLRGTWQTTAYYGKSNVVLSPFPNPGQANAEGLEDFVKILVEKGVGTTKEYETAKTE